MRTKTSSGTCPACKGPTTSLLSAAEPFLLMRQCENCNWRSGPVPWLSIETRAAFRRCVAALSALRARHSGRVPVASAECDSLLAAAFAAIYLARTGRKGTSV